ncbi:MAG: lytic transglycosylase domain-containing protein [Actinomycetota bacterium]
MKQRFLNTNGVRRMTSRTGAILTIIFLLNVQPVIFGQGNVITKAQFSRFSLNQRARVFEPTISRIAFEEQVDPHLLWTICYLETRFRPWLRSPAGALGLMQFIPATAARYNLFNPYQPEPAIKAAARYVKFLSNRFGGRIDSILAGYNAGEGAVDAFLWGKTVRSGKKIINFRGIKTVGGVPPYRETISYVARGLIIYRLLQKTGKFSRAVISSRYPPNISERVASVCLVDNEIGFNGSLLTQMNNPQFWNIPAFPNNRISLVDTVSKNSEAKVLLGKNTTQKTSSEKMNNSAFTAKTVSNDSITDNQTEEKAVKNESEIYYEPRTGARYRREGEKLERLPESGDLVVGAQTRTSRQRNSIRARGTFFGGKILQPK